MMIQNWKYDNATCDILNELLVMRKRNDLEKVTISMIDLMITNYRLKLRTELKAKAEQDAFTYYGGKLMRKFATEDAVIYKILYPNEHWSIAEMEEYREENWMNTCSPHDCSGEWFAAGIDIFNTPSGVLVFIGEMLDN